MVPLGSYFGTTGILLGYYCWLLLGYYLSTTGEPPGYFLDTIVVYRMVYEVLKETIGIILGYHWGTTWEPQLGTTRILLDYYSDTTRILLGS